MNSAINFPHKHTSSCHMKHCPMAAATSAVWKRVVQVMSANTVSMVREERGQRSEEERRRKGNGERMRESRGRRNEEGREGGGEEMGEK